jgi:hypothetical protein
MTKILENKVEKEQTLIKSCPVPWWKRLGILGFMFFFIKGLGWIAIFTISYVWGEEALESIKTFFSSLF